MKHRMMYGVRVVRTKQRSPYHKTSLSLTDIVRTLGNAVSSFLSFATYKPGRMGHPENELFTLK